jgi:molybdenum cofactor synthesis domain-containing protein
MNETASTQDATGRVMAVCSSERKGERKRPVAHAVLRVDHGVEGDAHAGPWHRQVSLLAAEDVAAMRARGLPDLQSGDFGENFVIEGLDPGRLGLGSRLELGGDAEIEVTQIGKTCHARCAIYHKTGDCIMPTRGLFARVLRGGPVRAGDRVNVSLRVSPGTFQTVVLTLSDRCSAGRATDTAGPAVARAAAESLGARLYAAEILPDEQEQIAGRLRHYADGPRVDLIVAVGGTGFAPRDVTPEAVRGVVERLTPGLDEAMRAASLRVTPHAMLSRCASGIRGRTLILSLPGSERAARENFLAVAPALPHALAKLRGDMSPCGEGGEPGGRP